MERRVVAAAQVMILAGILSCTGCTYLRNRGNDAADIWDFGVTVSEKPCFSLYVGFMSALPIGYSNFDGTMYGVAHRTAGALPARHHMEGLLLWGEEQWGHGTDFDPANPDSPASWKVGMIGLAEGPTAPKEHIVNCPKLIHLGWVGLTVECKWPELADFVLGWFGTDLMKDDAADAVPMAEPPAAGA